MMRSVCARGKPIFGLVGDISATDDRSDDATVVLSSSISDAFCPLCWSCWILLVSIDFSKLLFAIVIGGATVIVVARPDSFSDEVGISTTGTSERLSLAERVVVMGGVVVPWLLRSGTAASSAGSIRLLDCGMCAGTGTARVVGDIVELAKASCKSGIAGTMDP